MKRDDTTRIRHILDACHEIMTFKAGRSKDDIQRDRVLTLALVKEIEIIGEAAAKISKEGAINADPMAGNYRDAEPPDTRL